MSDSADKPDEECRQGGASVPNRPAESREQGIRRWRQPAEWAGRDNRPGFYSITGEFIELPESSRATSPDQSQ